MYVVAWLCFVTVLSVPSNGLDTTEQRLAALEKKLAIVETRNEQRVSVLEEELAVVKDMLSQEKMKSQTLTEEISAINRGPRHITEESQIAFSVASHQDFGPVPVDTTIPFSVVNVDVGGAWDDYSNAFRAPRAGVYVFTTSMVGQPSVGYTRAAIVHAPFTGPQRKASLLTDTETYDGDSNSVILRVAFNDLVYVTLLEHGGGSIHSSSDQVYSTFSGFFLFP